MKRIPSVPLRVDATATTWNRWNYRGVEKIRNKFRAVVGNKLWRSPYFATAAEAAAAYDMKARTVYGARGFYNFPKRGERQIEPADEEVCRQGHSRAQFTYFRPNGKPGYCRACNKQAQLRSAARRKVTR
jgi:hypothetical protein